MAELSEREIKLVHCMLTVINRELQDVPLDIRIKTIMATLTVRGLKYDETEITDLVMAIDSETKLVTQSAFGLLGKYGKSIKAFGNIKL